MVREGEDRLDDLHVKTLEIVENAVEDRETPVVRVRVIMDHPDIDVTKPTVHSRIDDLVEWGYLDRMKVGRAFVLWPADKYEDMAERLDDLESDKEYLERRVAELEEEKEEAREEAVEARAMKEAAERLEEEAALSPDQFLAPDFPTALTEELELRWRIRANAWRRTLGRIGTVIAMLVLAIVALFVLRPTLTGAVPGLDVGSVNAGLGLLIVISFLALGPAVLYLAAQAVAIGALVSPPFGRWADKPVCFLERHLGNGVPGEGEEPTGTDRVLTEAEE